MTVKEIWAVPTEIYSRVVGCFRPISSWNKGKREEFEQREDIDIPRKEN